MAGTCSHCGASIAGNLYKCPCCGNYCLLTQEKCPKCETPIKHPKEEEKESLPPKENGKRRPARKKSRKKIFRLLAFVILLILAGVALYYYNMYRLQQREQADYVRLEGVTNPEFYQQFLIDYPDSKHYEEINERMQLLLTETEDWKKLQKKVNRANVSLFMQKHPNSLRQRACEDWLDSIDWHDALAIGTEDAITDYLHRHPAGRYTSDAAEKKNAILLSKVTSEEKAMIRGTLEAFFSNAIGGQDIEAAKAAIPDSMINFCGKQNADAEAIIEYAKEKMEKDVIGLHYSIGQQMSVRKETLPDSNTGFAVEVSLHETISRSSTDQPTSHNYRVNALLNHEKKIVKMNIY